MDPIVSAWTPGRPLADPPGVLFARTQADMLRIPQESTVDPKIRSGFAADPPQVCGGAVDFKVSKKTEKVCQSAKSVQFTADFFSSLADYFGVQESDCLPLTKSAQKVHLKNLQADH